MGRHIPGNPAIIVRNMPGATSLIMTNQLYNRSPRDGTVMGMPNNNVPLEPRLKLLAAAGNVAFDVGRFSWIGTPVQEPHVLWVWHTAPATSFADLKTNKIVMGATAASADNSTLSLLMNQTLGTRMEIVTGYQGQNEINLAVERGEVQGNTTGLTNLIVTKADWIKQGKIRMLVQFGSERAAEIADVPTVLELATSQDDRAIWQLFTSKFKMARPLALPPDVPRERVTALRDAFDATMKDPLFLDEARKIGLELNPLGGEAIDGLIAQIQATPESVIERLRKLLMTRP
jgi:tripartite-type tricarboxylate transporter receptor subunit TctC